VSWFSWVAEVAFDVMASVSLLLRDLAHQVGWVGKLDGGVVAVPEYPLVAFTKPGRVAAVVCRSVTWEDGGLRHRRWISDLGGSGLSCGAQWLRTSNSTAVLVPAGKWWAPKRKAEGRRDWRLGCVLWSWRDRVVRRALGHSKRSYLYGDLQDYLEGLPTETDSESGGGLYSTVLTVSQWEPLWQEVVYSH